MGKKKEELRVPPRKHYAGFCYLTGKPMPSMTGRAWNDLADQNRFKWKRVGDPREGIKDLCGGGYEVHIN